MVTATTAVNIGINNKELVRQAAMELVNFFRTSCWFCSTRKRTLRECRNWDKSNTEGTETAMPPLNPDRSKSAIMTGSGNQ